MNRGFWQDRLWDLKQVAIMLIVMGAMAAAIASPWWIPQLLNRLLPPPEPAAEERIPAPEKEPTIAPLEDAFK